MNFQKQAQEYYARAPLIVLGSGASAAYGMSGMGALGEYLVRSTDTSGLSEKDVQAWAQFCELLKAKTDLETALQKVDVSDDLTSRIVTGTWKLLNSEDIGIFQRSLQDPKMFPLSRLLEHMFRTSLKTVDIVTTNYDRLAEYACDQIGRHHYSGFTHGAFRQLVGSKEISCKRTVNIWKVHGSLDWFKSPFNDVVALPVLSEIPPSFSPHIVTPGTQKYHRTHLEPYRSIIQNADAAMSAAESYLCIGYGFNDEHIQPKLIEKCVRKNAPLTIVTYSLSPAAAQMVRDRKIQKFLAITRGSNDDESIIYSSESENPISTAGNFWSLGGYLSLVM